MPVIRRSDEYSVHILQFQHFSIVAKSFDPGRINLHFCQVTHSAIENILIYIAERYNVYTLMFQQSTEIGKTHAVDTDSCQIDLI